jgi:hypothetical protein
MAISMLSFGGGSGIGWSCAASAINNAKPAECPATDAARGTLTALTSAAIPRPPATPG